MDTHNLGYFFLAYTFVVVALMGLFAFLLYRVKSLEAQVRSLLEEPKGSREEIGPSPRS